MLSRYQPDGRLLESPRLKNASHRLGMPKTADITKARTLATRRGEHLKMNISYGHELINWEMSVYFGNVGFVQQLIKKLISACGELEPRVAGPKRKRLPTCLHFSKTRVSRPVMV